MTTHGWITALAGAALLGGCSTYDYQHPLILSSAGYLHKDKVVNGQPSGSSQWAVFKESFTAAQTQAIADTRATGLADEVNSKRAQFIYKRFAVAGMSVVYDDCSDFFASRGSAEQQIGFYRDLVTAGGTITSGALALAGAPQSAVASVSLTTAAANDGLDIYTKNFLFSADNIDSVRTLILGSLTKHEDAVLANSAPWTYENAMQVVLDHQELCRNSAIVSLVRGTIKGGKTDAVPAGGTTTTITPATAADTAATAKISQQLGLPDGTALTPTQLGGVYWLVVVGDDSNAAEQVQIKAAVAGVPVAPYTPTFDALEATLKPELLALSDATQASFKATIAKAKAPLAPVKAPPAPPKPAPAKTPAGAPVKGHKKPVVAVRSPVVAPPAPGAAAPVAFVVPQSAPSTVQTVSSSKHYVIVPSSSPQG